jgi:hypothetical protein
MAGGNWTPRGLTGQVRKGCDSRCFGRPKHKGRDDKAVATHCRHKVMAALAGEIEVHSYWKGTESRGGRTREAMAAL